jgi:serine/threonine protein kinase
MNPERFARLRELVLTLPRLPEAERKDFLDRACTGDPELRREAESLLAWDPKTGVPEVARTGGAPGLFDLPPVSDLAATFPDRIGPYCILGVLGQGGMGVVYRAEQTEPIQREVAIKLISQGLDRRSVLARFEAERQTLAIMEHPGIARVLDAGEDEEGRPYFVMELVRGIPITEFCLVRSLSLKDRLRLFRKVCLAVQHAHQKGIIHRDIKPSNILVTTLEGEPAPKIIDFGIAKAMGETIAVGTLTQDGQMVGTIEYMSPEQAEGRPGGVDTRSDVYSLGVVLYELTSGVLPYETKGKSIVEAARIIADESPRPLHRTATGESRPDEEISTIIYKALEKEPNRRYGNAADLAEDIGRYLSGFPILAHPPSTTYQLKKMVKRHKTAFALSTALFALAIVFGITMSILFQAQRVERARAEAEAEKALRVSNFLRGMLSSVESRGESATVKEILDAASRDVDAEFGDQPEIRAVLHSTIGGAYTSLRTFEEAEHHLNISLDIRREIFGERHPEVAESLIGLARCRNERVLERKNLAWADSLACVGLAMQRDLLGDDHPDVTAALVQLARIRDHREQWESADSLYVEAIARERRRLGDHHPRVGQLLSERAKPLYYLGNGAEAFACLGEALAILQGAYSGDHWATAQCMSKLGHMLGGVPERQAESESLLVESLAMHRRLWGEGHPNLVEGLNELGGFYLHRWRFEEGEPLFREALAITRMVDDERHGRVARMANNLAALLDRKGEYREAESLYRFALDAWVEALEPTSYTVFLGRANLARVLGKLGEDEEAWALFQEGLALAEETLGPESGTAGLHLRRMAMYLNRRGRYEEAEPRARKALEIFGGSEFFHLGLMSYAQEALAWALHGLGRLEEAEVLYVRADSIHCLAGELAPSGINNRVRLAACIRDQGRLDEAERHLRDARARFQTQLGEQHPDYANMLLELGALCVECGEWEEAAELLGTCRERLEASGYPSDLCLPRVQELLGRVPRRTSES